jgi:hypothetical protein
VVSAFIEVCDVAPPPSTSAMTSVYEYLLLMESLVGMPPAGPLLKAHSQLN